LIFNLLRLFVSFFIVVLVGALFFLRYTFTKLFALLCH
jgi:hypothetical protein